METRNWLSEQRHAKQINETPKYSFTILLLYCYCYARRQTSWVDSREDLFHMYHLPYIVYAPVGNDNIYWYFSSIALTLALLWQRKSIDDDRRVTHFKIPFVRPFHLSVLLCKKRCPNFNHVTNNILWFLSRKSKEIR